MDEPDTKLLIFVLCKGRGKGRTLSRGTNWHLPFAENLILKPAFILFYILAVVCLSGVRKQSTFRDATTNFPSKWRLRNEGRNSMLMTYRYPDISSASDWLDICFNQSEALFRSGLWVERHQYGSNYCASGFFTRTSRGETSGGISKCRLFSQAHFSGLGVCRPFCLFSSPGLFEEQELSGSETITWVCHNFASLFKELCQEMFQNSNSGNSHQIEWNIKITFQNINRRHK